MLRRRSLEGKLALEGFLLISPWVVGFLLFVAYPLAESFWFSFQDVKLKASGYNTVFIGLKNYKEAFSLDVKFAPLLYEAASRLLLQLPIVISFALIIALLLNRKMPGTGLFRALFFLPVVFASGIVLRELFSQDVASLPVMDRFDMAAALGPDAAKAVTALLQEVTRHLWGSGVQILIFLAGIQAISPSLYEAADVDGATDWEKFWKITLPTLSPIILLNVIYTIVDGFTDVFNPVLFYIRDVGLRGQFRMGYAAALGWIYFVLVFLIIAAVLRISRKRVYYAGER